MGRHVTILRELAHELSPDAPRPDRPATAAEAQARVEGFLSVLSEETPRTGLGAATGHFVDHLVATTSRYGAHLFVCFDDARIPATTNELEGFFSRAKHRVRQALGSGDSTQSVVGNLGAEVLLAFADCGSPDALGRLRTLTPEQASFREARARIAREEAPATRRRSQVRHLDRHLANLRRRWLSPASQPPNA